MTCEIEQLDDVVSIYPLIGLAYKVPFYIPMSSINLGSIGITDLEAFLAEVSRFSTLDGPWAARNVLIDEKPTIKSAAEASITGYTYKVTMSWKVISNQGTAKSWLEDMKRKAHDFIIETGAGNFFLIRSAEEAYECLTEENLSDAYTITANVGLKNLDGLLPIIV